MRTTNRRGFIALATGLVSMYLPLGGTTPVTFAQEKVEPTEIWEVSTRHLGTHMCGCVVPRPDFDVHRSELCNPNWTPKTYQDLKDSVEGDPETITVFYAHGNWMTRENTRERAHFITQHLHARGNPKLRFVFLSWPSQREPRPVQNSIENSEKAEIQAFYLAYLLRDLRKCERLSLLGFSLGGKVVTGALHLDAGGSIDGRQLEEAAIQDSRSYRVSLSAPAVDRSSMQPHGRFGLAMSHVDRLVNTYNSRDPALRRFRFLENPGRPIAAGFAGFIGISQGDPISTEPLASQDRVVQFDCSRVLGITHDERSYYNKCRAFGVALDNLLWLK